MSNPIAAPGAIRSTIPGRLDALAWSPFHTRMVEVWGGLDPPKRPPTA